MENTYDKSLYDFYEASAAIKADFTEERLSNLLECLEDVYLDDLLSDLENAEKAIADLPMRFYDHLADDFVDSLNNHPELWMMSNSLLHQVLTDEMSHYIIQRIFKTAPGTNAEYFYKGDMALQNDSPDLALIYFDQMDHFLANLYKANCYSALDSYSNAIKNNILFLKGLDNFMVNVPLAGIENNHDLIMFKWDVYTDLVYLYYKTQHYNLAIDSFKKSLSYQSVNLVYGFLSSKPDGLDRFSQFERYINNYLFALQKAHDYDTAVEFLESVLHLVSDTTFYQKQLSDLKERITRHQIADDLLKNIVRVKRPFNIESFTKTESLAREKNLEDMIVEQIKYGFTVFDKTLELYQDDNIYGRQYFVRGANGFLDLLLIDRGTDTLYVVELKRGLAGVEVVDQIEKYMEALRDELDKPIKGIICLHQANPELTKLVESKEDIELFTYRFDFKKLG